MLYYFQIAMKMYTLADKAIAPEEFSRAVTICTGRQLSPYVVKTVFQVIKSQSCYEDHTYVSEFRGCIKMCLS